jgi:centrosomal protein CEP41
MENSNPANDKENINNFETQSVVSNAESHMSSVSYTTEMLGVTADTKFILLDLRDSEDYKAWHIKEAINFPAPNITQDKTFS